MNKIEIADFCTKHNITLKQFFGFDTISGHLRLNKDWNENKKDTYIPEGFYPQLKNYSDSITLTINNRYCSFNKDSCPSEIIFNRKLAYHTYPYTTDKDNIDYDKSIVRQQFYGYRDRFTDPKSNVREVVDFKTIKVETEYDVLLDKLLGGGYDTAHEYDYSCTQGLKIEKRGNIIKCTEGTLIPILNFCWCSSRLPEIVGCDIKYFGITEYIDLLTESLCTDYLEGK
jgi:hypothetical protein